MDPVILEAGNNLLWIAGFESIGKMTVRSCLLYRTDLQWAGQSFDLTKKIGSL